MRKTHERNCAPLRWKGSRKMSQRYERFKQRMPKAPSLVLAATIFTITTAVILPKYPAKLDLNRPNRSNQARRDFLSPPFLQGDMQLNPKELTENVYSRQLTCMEHNIDLLLRLGWIKFPFIQDKTLARRGLGPMGGYQLKSLSLKMKVNLVFCPTRKDGWIVPY